MSGMCGCGPGAMSTATGAERYASTSRAGREIAIVWSAAGKSSRILFLFLLIAAAGPAPCPLQADEGAPLLGIELVPVDDFLVGRFEVTQEQYRRVMGSNPSRFLSGDGADRRPVDSVTWLDAVTFCNAASRLEGLTPVYRIVADTLVWDTTADGYRLPTDEEWLLAAGDRTTYAGSDQIGAVAWYRENSKGQTHRVGLLGANERGIHDMTGNVSEWVWDAYDADPGGRPESTGSDTLREAVLPAGNRVVRGGAWSFDAYHSRTAYRNFSPADVRASYFGFRIARNLAAAGP